MFIDNLMIVSGQSLVVSGPSRVSVFAGLAAMTAMGSLGGMGRMAANFRTIGISQANYANDANGRKFGKQ